MHPRQEPGGRATDPHDLPCRPIDLRASQRRCAEEEAQERGAHVPASTPSVCSVVQLPPLDADALCVRADLALRKIWRWRRRIGLSDRARTRLRRRQTHLAHAQAWSRSIRSHRAATTSCSSVCRSRAHASSETMRTSARERRHDEHRDFSRARLGASTPASRSHDRHAA